MLYTANVGDARTVIGCGGKAFRLSIDHKTNVSSEIERVTKAGGFIVNGRVGGALMISRAFGDIDFEEMGIIADPFLVATPLEQDHTHLIMACDGLWDVCTDQEALNIALRCESAQKASKQLLEYALEHGSKDNITIVVLKLGSAFKEAWLMLEIQLENHIKKKAFEQEWAALEERQLSLSETLFSDALKQENKAKNRYINIIPFNSTRVVLPTKSDDISNNYINGSWVKTESGLFIATQAPLPHTFADFYRMIWESNAKTIVMLTKYIEDGKLKADNYLPEEKIPLKCGEIDVELISIDVPSDHFVVRTLKLAKGSQKCIVSHYYYVSWPDHGVPQPESLLSMMKVVLSSTSQDKSPTIVHCSAGVGRSGTWIALCTLLHIIEKAINEYNIPTINIMETLQKLREHRMGMFTHISQYEFAYNTILAHLKNNKLIHPDL